MGLSFVLRSTIGEVAQSDIDQYIKLMDSKSEIPYFLREFIFWFSSRYLYNLLGDGASVFIVLDFVLFCLLYKGFALNRVAFFSSIKEVEVRYILFGLFLFFPYVAGMHNVYRQILALSLFLCAIGYFGNDKLYKGFVFFLIAVFVHNAIVLFFPSLLFVSNKIKYKALVVGTILVALAIVFFEQEIIAAYVVKAEGFKSGENIAFLYLLVLVIIFSAILMVEFKARKNSVFIGYILMLIITYAISAFSLTSGGAERVAYYTFAMMFPVLAYYIESRFKDKVTMRVVYYHFSLVPILTIHSALI